MRAATVIILVVLGLSVSACGGGDEDAPDFVDVMHDRYDDYRVGDISDETFDRMMSDAADTICEAFDEGNSWSEIVQALTDEANNPTDDDDPLIDLPDDRLNVDEFGAIVDAAVADRCPEHADD